MNLIPLTQGKFAIVDDEDFAYLNQFKWTYMGGGTNNYAYRKDYSNGFRKTVRMHRLLIEAKPGLDVDHINRNGLDNRKSNLRVVDRSQNNFNTSLRVNNTSGHKGISWNKRIQSWRVYIGGSKKRVELGHFKDLKQAIIVRKNAEKEHIICV